MWTDGRCGFMFVQTFYVFSLCVSPVAVKGSADGQSGLKDIPPYFSWRTN